MNDLIGFALGAAFARSAILVITEGYWAVRLVEFALALIFLAAIGAHATLTRK